MVSVWRGGSLFLATSPMVGEPVERSNGVGAPTEWAVLDGQAADWAPRPGQRSFAARTISVALGPRCCFSMRK